jgi:hypothetical protein
VTLGGLQGFRRKDKIHLCKILQVMGYIQSLGYIQILTPDAHYRHYKKIRHLLILTIVSGGGLVKKKQKMEISEHLAREVCVCVCVVTKPISIAPQYS